MRINVNGGHTPLAPGASGYLDELTEDRKVKDALIRILRERGHEVSDSTTNEATQGADLAEQARRANASGAELAISIHFNAGGGTGPEVWYYAGSKSAAVHASAISARLAELMGLRNRGAKSTTQLYWLKHTRMTSVLVEVVFVDTRADAEAYRAVGPEAVARAIADAVVGGGEPVKPAGPGLDVDGWWGKATTAAMQAQLGTEVDGLVSRQPSQNEKACERAAHTSWQFGSTIETPSGFTGSWMVQELQRLVGADVDGWMGPKTITALQKWLRGKGYKKHDVNGVLDENTVANVQNALNARLFEV